MERLSRENDGTTSLLGSARGSRALCGDSPQRFAAARASGESPNADRVAAPGRPLTGAAELRSDFKLVAGGYFDLAQHDVAKR